jgi:hypothetical protein
MRPGDLGRLRGGRGRGEEGGGESRLGQAVLETFAALLGPGGPFDAGSSEPAVTEVTKPAVQEVFGRELPDGLRVGHHIDQSRDLGAAVANDHGGDARGQDFAHFLDVPQDDAIRIQGFEQRPGAFEPRRFPIEGPGTVVMGVLGDAAEEVPTGGARGFEQQHDLGNGRGLVVIGTWWCIERWTCDGATVRRCERFAKWRLIDAKWRWVQPPVK